MDQPLRTLVADRGDAGRRIDLVIRRHLADLARATRTRVQAWIADGRVAVNGRTVLRVSARAALGDVITLTLPDDVVRLPVVAEEGPLECLFEDEFYLAANKPAGVVSHPTFRHPGGSLLNVLMWHARTWPRDQRPSLVGRLDKLTSGIVIAAKTTTSHARLQRTLASSHSEKVYLALAYGPMSPERGEIALRLRRHPSDRRRVIATPDDGLPSLTQFERLAHVDAAGCSVVLARCRLVTGRMHQIRVHLSACGWPLVGDLRYGEARWRQCSDDALRKALRSFRRQALHAWQVSFVHPFTRQRIELRAPLPDDLRRLLQACGISEPA